MILPLIYTALLYGTLPLVRSATRVLRAHGLLRVTLLALCLALAMIAVNVMVKRLRVPMRRALAAAAVFALVYGALFYAIQPPEEFTHFIEYGILPLLWMRALGQRFKGGRLYAAALALCAATGLGDELIQGWLPARYFEWRDVGLNIAATVLGLAAWGVAHRLGRRDQ